MTTETIDQGHLTRRSLLVRGGELGLASTVADWARRLDPIPASVLRQGDPTLGAP